MALDVTLIFCSLQIIHLLHVDHKIKRTRDLENKVYLQCSTEYKKYLHLTLKDIGRREDAIIHSFTDEETENSGSL